MVSFFDKEAKKRRSGTQHAVTQTRKIEDNGPRDLKLGLK